MAYLLKILCILRRGANARKINAGGRVQELHRLINGAYAIRRARSLQDALAFLLKGEETLKNDPIFHFNLACYHCQLGHMDEAKPLIQKAIQLHPAVRDMIFNEPDLAPLWSHLRV